MYCLLANYSDFWMKRQFGRGSSISYSVVILKFCQTRTTKSIQKHAFSVEFDSLCQVWSRGDCSGAFILNSPVFYIVSQAFL